MSVSTELASQRSTAAVVGKKRTRGQPAVAPRVIAFALLQAELHPAARELAGDNTHLAGRQLQCRAGKPPIHRRGGGEEAHARQLAVAPRVIALALLEAELDPAARELARHDTHLSAVAFLLSGDRYRDNGPAQHNQPQPPRQHKPRADRQRGRLARRTERAATVMRSIRFPIGTGPPFGSPHQLPPQELAVLTGERAPEPRHFEIDTPEVPSHRVAAAIEISPRSTANTIRTLSSADFDGGVPINDFLQVNTKP